MSPMPDPGAFLEIQPPADILDLTSNPDTIDVLLTITPFTTVGLRT